ncbi:hypothetical protein FRC09_009297 [Ceratobasidium sp. 395]|nr:hypothetical protein FRC09_009297 [Ceratobasidium sp. 395]
MSSSISLTEAEINQEHTWLAKFNQALDSLDIRGRWAPFLADSRCIYLSTHFFLSQFPLPLGGFVQFANDPRVEQKDAVLTQLATLFGYFQSIKHSTTRVSLDPAAGLIYHSASVSMQVKRDPQERVFTVPALITLHKKPGEEQAAGMEVYIDIGPAKEVLKELAEKK